MGWFAILPIPTASASMQNRPISWLLRGKSEVGRSIKSNERKH